MFVCSNEKKEIIYFYVYVYLLIIKKKYKELEHSKLEFHITRSLSLVNSGIIEEKKRALRSSFVFTKNSGLVSSSIVLHGTRVLCSMWHFFKKKKSMSAQVFFFFLKLECLKLDLHSKLEFHELEFQKSGILLLIL